MYVCLGSKIPWIRMYIAKIPHKNIHMFMQQNTSWKKKQTRTKIYLSAKKPTCFRKENNFQLFFEKDSPIKTNGFVEKNVYAPEG